MKSINRLNLSYAIRAAEAGAKPKHSPTNKAVPPEIIEKVMAETKWWTLGEIAKQYAMSHEFVRRGIKGRLGVRKDGATYKVPDFVLGEWLTELVKANC
jgi:hypothetical protein